MSSHLILTIFLIGFSWEPLFASQDTQNCEVGNKKSCVAGFICEQKTNNNSVCTAIPPVAPISEFVLPFSSTVTVICTHDSGNGSHAWSNALFALDLASKYNEPAPLVLAAQGGKVFIFQGEDGNPCPTPEGTPQNSKPDKCGNGWGNHVKILHSDGYYSFYVHLEKILVKNGELIKQGQVIGTMGMTGLAGHRHLHWSVQRLPGEDQTEWEKQILTYDGQSVPFTFKARNKDGTITNYNSSEIICPHANIGLVPESEQPHFQGLVK